MMIYPLIPILSIYAGWRIQKFWLLFIVNFVGIVTGFIGAAAEEAGTPSGGIILGLAISIPVSLFLVRKFAVEYNEKIARETPPSDSSPHCKLEVCCITC